MKLRRRNLLIIFGTRPEAIKLASLIRELKSRPAEFHTRTCVTAQHRGMLDQVLGAFEIAPDHDLEVMREVTERPEAVEAGTAKLVGTNGERIVEETTRLLEEREEYARMSRVLYPFGDGQASQRIARILAEQG